MLFYLFLLLGNPVSSAIPKNNSNLDKRTFYGDPRRNITCLGSSYDLQLSIRRDGVDPNHFSMQQLCAKTIYGGAPAGQHLGGWCSQGLPSHEIWPAENGHNEVVHVDENPSLAGVSFDLSDASHAADADPRFLLGCFNRCFCNWGVDDLTIQPKRSVPSDADILMNESSGCAEIALDVTDDVTTTAASHDGRLGDVQVDSVKLVERVEPNEEGGFTSVRGPEPDPP